MKNIKKVNGNSSKHFPLTKKKSTDISTMTIWFNIILYCTENGDCGECCSDYSVYLVG